MIIYDRLELDNHGVISNDYHYPMHPEHTQEILFDGPNSYGSWLTEINGYSRWSLSALLDTLGVVQPRSDLDLTPRRHLEITSAVPGCDKFVEIQKLFSLKSKEIF